MVSGIAISKSVIKIAKLTFLNNLLKQIIIQLKFLQKVIPDSDFMRKMYQRPYGIFIYHVQLDSLADFNNFDFLYL